MPGTGCIQTDRVYVECSKSFATSYIVKMVKSYVAAGCSITSSDGHAFSNFLAIQF